MRVIIAGSRGFNDYRKLEEKMDHLLQNQKDVIIISGNAKGADTLGETYAVARNYGLETYPADWDEYGKSAGYIRNEQMAKIADAAVIFWDGVSKGSKHMIDLAHKHNLKVRVIKY